MKEVKEHRNQYYYNQPSEDDEISLLVKFCEGDEKWKKVNSRNGRDNQHLANGNRVQPPEDKASKRYKRDEVLESNFVTNWEEV